MIMFFSLYFLGEFTVIYLYLKFRFDWNEVMFGIFLFYGCFGMAMGKFSSNVSLLRGGSLAE